MTSPLGQYASVVAAILAVFLVVAFVLASVFSTVLHIDPLALDNLKFFAVLAGGAVFGGAAAVNGWKQPLVAAHTRLDVQDAKLAALGTVVADSNPAAAVAVHNIIAPEPVVTPPATSG